MSTAMTVGVAIDDWKLKIFERRLKKAGYVFTQHPGVTSDTLLLKVKTDNKEALLVVVKAANNEAATTGKQKEKGS